MKLLLLSQADINKTNIHGNTALIVAARSVNTECVYVLIEAGADVNIANNLGN